mmetsp:Transcript_87919/g.277962  ORF Transcript_87919/g.277962 Transcript_87919/m.277962 type:complete len:299 (+) Transcript_87919:696-1592(+)
MEEVGHVGAAASRSPGSSAGAREAGRGPGARAPDEVEGGRGAARQHRAARSARPLLVDVRRPLGWRGANVRRGPGAPQGGLHRLARKGFRAAHAGQHGGSPQHPQAAAAQGGASWLQELCRALHAEEDGHPARGREAPGGAAEDRPPESPGGARQPAAVRAEAQLLGRAEALGHVLLEPQAGQGALQHRLRGPAPVLPPRTLPCRTLQPDREDGRRPRRAGRGPHVAQGREALQDLPRGERHGAGGPLLHGPLHAAGGEAGRRVAVGHRELRQRQGHHAGRRHRREHAPAARWQARLA